MQTDFEQLRTEIKELIKNIKVITPHQLESPYNSYKFKESNGFQYDVFVIDYLNMIGNKNDR